MSSSSGLGRPPISSSSTRPSTTSTSTAPTSASASASQSLSTEAEAAAAAVETILDRRVGRQDTPKDEDLAPVFAFLLPNASPNAPVSQTTSSTDAPPHWFCPAARDLERRAATYLIVLFAFKQQGTSKIWIDTLAKVLKGCKACARAFAGARRTWERL